MYHANPYARTLHARRALAGLGDYRTDLFTMLPPDQQQQAADILDKGKDSVTALIQSPTWDTLPQAVRLAIASERLAVSGGAYSDFLELVATKTPEQVSAYMNTAEFMAKPADFQFAVIEYVKWKASQMQAGQADQGGVGQGGQGAQDGGQGGHGGQGAQDGGQGGQGAQDGGTLTRGSGAADTSLQNAYSRMAQGNTSTGGAKVKEKTPWLLWLLLAFVVYQATKKPAHRTAE